MRAPLKGLFAAVYMAVLPVQPAHAAASFDEVLLMTSGANPGGVAVKEDQIRVGFLRDEGFRIGVYYGLAARSERIAARVEEKRYDLDRSYRFSALLDENGMLPPVVSEVRDETQVEGERKREMSRVLKYEKPATFVSVAPTWRNYLFVGLLQGKGGEPALPDPSLKPKDDKERAIWKEALQSGWAAGEKQAEDIFAKNLARMERDFVGMVRYKSLVSTGLAKKPSVSVTRAAVSGDGKTLVLGDTLSAVTKPSEFNLNSADWKPVVIRND